MGSYRSSKVARRLVTVLVMLTVLVTTFLPGWDSPVQAAPVAPGSAATVPTGRRAVTSPGGSATGSASVRPPASQVPLNALVLSQPGQADALASAIVNKGGTLYVHEGNALFVGLDELGYADLAPLGARAVYQDTVPSSELARLSSIDRDAATTWNQIAAAQPSHSETIATAGGTSSGVFLSVDRPPASPSPGLHEPNDIQTSIFMLGDVAVKVVFVESHNVGNENWSENEVAKVKTEVVQALDWWTTAATAPESPGGDPRPSANLTWDVSYVSPFDGSDFDKSRILVDVEPIANGIWEGGIGATGEGWMAQVAAAFTGLPPGEDAIRQLAHNTRAEAGDDWGLVLYVVDSSTDSDGKFADGKAAGAALNGPWAVVSYDGGSLGVDNLEILIAKMIGHVFGAGDESYDPAFLNEGCRNEEYYGYLRISHDNCQHDNHNPDPSLMLSGQRMIDAYHGHQLSRSARAQIGWRDSDANGIYDVLDTLSDTYDNPSGQAICPILHLLEIPINNFPVVPDEVGPGQDETHWRGLVWDPEAINLVPGPEFTPVNINRPGFVWGRINEGEWVAGDPADGAWDSLDESYNLILPATAGELNRVEIAIMNRWEQQAYLSTNPVSVTVLAPPDSGGPYQSDDTDSTELYLTSTTGWTKSSDDPSYSGGSTEVSNGVGAEACFAFNGTEATILHSTWTDGHANVYVDGKLHSIITYDDSGFTQVRHTIADLAPGDHAVTLVATDGVVDFDAWAITNTVSGERIDAWGDPGLSPDGFYEALSAPNKVKYVGAWAEVPLAAPDRPGAPSDGLGMSSVHAYDRVYAFFTHADTVAIYRGVFPGGGSADVYVDGSLRGTMYNDAKVAGVMPFYIGGLDPNADHTVEVSINPDAPHFDLDAMRFLYLSNKVSPDLYIADTPGVSLDVPYTGAQERYEKWTPNTSGHFMQTNEQGALQTVFFQGSAVAVQVGTGSTLGILEIYVDGRLERTIDNKTQASSNMPIVVHGYDPTLPHVLQIRHINARPLYPKANKVYGFTVYSVPPVGPGSYEEYEYDAANKPTRSDFIYEQKWAFSAVITSNPGPSQRRFIRAVHSDARAYLYFTGADSLTIYGVSGGYGAADIYINGELKGTFIQKGKTGYNHPYTITGLDPGATNCLELRVSTMKGMPKTISLDRVELFNKPVLQPGTYENDALIDIGGGQTAPALQFSGQWNRVANASASGGTYDMVGSINDEVVFDVRNATSVVLYRRLYSRYGQAEVYVDGKLRYTFDNYVYSPTGGVFRQKYVISGLDPGFDHRIRIVPARIGKKANNYKPFDIDYIQVRTGDVSGINYLENAYYENDDAAALAGGAISYVGTTWITGAVSTARIKGEKAVVSFYGNAFSVYFNKNNASGKVDIYIDGVLQGTYNTYSSTVVERVPFSVAGLEEGMHIAEVVLKTARVNINAYRAYTAEPNTGPTTYTMSPTDTRLILSGQWTVSGGYLTTKEKDARLFLFVTGGDTLVVTHQKPAPTATGDIQVSVNGTLHSTIDAAYIKSLAGLDGNYVVTGLAGMRTMGYWIEISNPKPKTISLKQLRVDRVENIMTPLTDDGQPYEAEGTEHVIPSGFWWRQPGLPTVGYNGSFYKESKNKFARYYIPTQNVSYLTIYRPVNSGFGDADVYLDGEFWGVMPNSSGTLRKSVPFSVGPIPDPSSVHVVELRPSKTKKLGLDYFIGVGMQTIGPGYYENDSAAFVGGTDPVSGKTYFNAYTGYWRLVTDAQASGGTLHEARTRGDRLSAVFEGNEIVIYRRTLYYGGYMTAYVDGVAYPIFNKSATTVRGVTHTILLPDNGPHSLELYNNSGWLDFDAIEIKTAVPATKGAYQHDSPYVVVNGAWNTVTSDLHSEGSYVMTNQKYASAFLLFSGDRVTTYLTRGKNWGIVNAYLDGVLVNSVDLYLYDLKLHPTDEPFFEYDLANLEGGTHVLELRFEGKKNRRGKPIINFDAFTVNGYPVPRPGEHLLPTDTGGGGGGVEILPEFGCYEENNFTWWKYVGPSENSWFTQQALLEASGTPYGMYRRGRSNNAGDVYAEFAFKGTSFGFVYRKGLYGGYADIYLDGAYQGYIDMYAPDDVWITTSPYEVLYERSGLDPDKKHVLRIVFTHNKNPDSHGYDIYVDRIELPAYSTDASCRPPIDPPTP